jgi:hypothetical protein
LNHPSFSGDNSAHKKAAVLVPFLTALILKKAICRRIENGRIETVEKPGIEQKKMP